MVAENSCPNTRPFPDTINAIIPATKATAQRPLPLWLTMISAFLSVPTDETEHRSQRGFRLAQRDTTSVSRIDSVSIAWVYKAAKGVCISGAGGIAGTNSGEGRSALRRSEVNELKRLPLLWERAARSASAIARGGIVGKRRQSVGNEEIAFAHEQKQNAHEEIAFPDEQKRNAHKQIAFPDEQKRNAHKQIAFPDEQKRNAHEEIALLTSKSEMLTSKSETLTSKSLFLTSKVKC